MTDRDRLIELFEAVEKDPAITCPHYKTEKTCDTCKYTINNFMCNHTERMVDYLLANGVKLSAELQNKCGSCVYAKPIVAFGKSKCYVNCTNKEHIERFCTREISTLRQRTHPACKKYKECGNNG